uniref:KASH domain-containing protein n=1 Tax=Oryzias melastigma TaxID=30732 RepID=A0A3B3BUZ8_ORYME
CECLVYIHTIVILLLLYVHILGRKNSITLSEISVISVSKHSACSGHYCFLQPDSGENQRRSKSDFYFSKLSLHLLIVFFFTIYFQTSSSEGKRAASFRGATVQQDLYDAVSAASSWLDTTENHLLSGPVLLSEDTHTRLTHLEDLNKTLKESSREVKECRDWLHGGTGRIWGAEEHTLIEDTLEGLQERMGLLDSVLEQHCDNIRDGLQEHTDFQVRVSLGAFQSERINFFARSVYINLWQSLQTLSEVDDSLREFEQKVAELRSTADRLQLDQTSNQELLKLQDTYEELVLMVGSRRSSLNQGLSLKAQYEAALRDLTELVDTAKDKMAADQKMTVVSVLEVQILLDKHKEFFQFLERHMILTRTFYSKVSGLVTQRESHALEETMTSAFNVLKQAHRRGVELEGILESWRRFVEDYQALCKQLEAVESSIPAVGLVEETEERITERISLYQCLKASLAEHQPQLYQVLEEGRRLLLSVSFVFTLVCAEHGKPAPAAETGGHGWSENSAEPDRHSVGGAADSHPCSARKAAPGWISFRSNQKDIYIHTFT